MSIKAKWISSNKLTKCKEIIKLEQIGQAALLDSLRAL